MINIIIRVNGKYVNDLYVSKVTLNERDDEKGEIKKYYAASVNDITICTFDFNELTKNSEHQYLCNITF